MRNENIAVVVLDTLRKDTFSRYFEWVPGTTFENAYSTSHWTVPAHASLLTGRYASEVGIHGKSRSFDCPEESIVEVLRADGYTTRMWTSNVQIAAWEGWDRGFDQFLEPLEIHPDADESVDWSAFDEVSPPPPLKYLAALEHVLTSSARTIPSLRYGLRILRSNIVTDDARSVLERLRRTDFGDREFLFVNLMEAHAPHYPPEPFRSVDERVNFRIGDAFAGLIDDPDRNRRAYDDSAAFLSSEYRRIFRELRRNFDYVITLSDHGELLGEHGMWNHGYGIYPELAHVPLVVSGDDVETKTREEVVSLLDVPQTISTLTGTEFENRGMDLLGDDAPVERLVEFHGFLPWHREQFERKGVPEVFDRFDDPLDGLVTKEGAYIYQTHGHGVVSPAGEASDGDVERLEELVSSLSKRVTREDTADVSASVRKRLEELGYA